MLDHVVIEPMSARFIVWRCLHSGPLSPANIDQWPPDVRIPWQSFRARNMPLLEKLTATYGACAMLARDGEQVVGALRFYPKAIATLEEAGGLCLQQAFPAGPSERLVERRFPPLDELEDKTLAVHCLMTGNPAHKENPYQRRGLGTRVARELAAWARERGWRRIEATAYEDLPILYAFTGQAGKSFWEKLGFRLAETTIEPEFEREGAFVKTMREQAAALGLKPEDIRNKYTMRLELA